MTLWLDEQLSPHLAPWIERHFDVVCVSIINLPVDRHDDLDIFMAAREAAAVIVSKDSDFIEHVDRLGPPPHFIWVTCGNSSNAAIKKILFRQLQTALNLIRSGEQIVEIR
jgi:predicted nuclease of predicted toxin-antitoxin system